MWVTKSNYHYGTQHTYPLGEYELEIQEHTSNPDVVRVWANLHYRGKRLPLLQAKTRSRRNDGRIIVHLKMETVRDLALKAAKAHIESVLNDACEALRLMGYT